MHEPLTNLISSLVPGPQILGGEKSSPLQGKEKVGFFDVLSMLSSGESGEETAAPTVDGSRGNGVLSSMAGILPALLASDTGDLSQSLQKIASAKESGIGKASSPSAASSDASGSSGSAQKTDFSVQTLLSTLSTLFGTKGIATNGARSVSDNLTTGTAAGSQVSPGTSSSPIDSGGPSSASMGTKSKGAAHKSSPEGSSDDPGPAQDTKDALQTLAILVFNSLAAALQNQPQETPVGLGSAGTATDGPSSTGGKASGTNGTVGGPGQEMVYQALVDLGRLFGGASSPSQPAQDNEEGREGVDEASVKKSQSGAPQEPGSTPADLLRTLNRGSPAWTNQLRTALRAEGSQGSSKEAVGETSVPTDVSPEETSSPSAEIRLTVSSSAAEGADDSGALTVALKAPPGAVAQNGATQVANDAVGGGSAPKTELAPDKADAAITAIVKDLSPLLKRDDDGSAQNSGGDKERPSGQDGYQFAAKVDAAGMSGAGQDETGKTSGQTVATAAVERFEKIIEQFGNGAAQHDLTVKLDIGNEGSVILGLKDLGPSVTVEVRASDQGIISLLQSQKDSIVSSLEGKDVHANIFIDPNASGTPDRKDRRETGRQRTFQPAPKVDAGFGEFLDVFA